MLETKSNPQTLNFIKYLTITITTLTIIFIIYALKLGIFQNENILINYIKETGIIAPIIFIIFQILQVIIPIVPGGVSCLAGVILFGPVQGFIYNYISIIIGSCIAFHLSKKYGLNLIKRFFKEDTINKYLKYLQNKKFKKILFINILLPGLPDDLLCYIAGLSTISFKNFLTIILLGKPISLLFYSIFIDII